MHGGQARYVAFGDGWMDSAAANSHWVLPPDVEPLPERTSDTPSDWLAKRYIAPCDRGAALKGLSMGEALAELLLGFASVARRCSLGNAMSPASADDVRSRASLPRLRRSAFYRRARALQFKRNPVR